MTTHSILIFDRNNDRELPIRFLSLFGGNGILSARFWSSPISFKVIILGPFLLALGVTLISWMYEPAIMVPYIIAMKFGGLFGDFLTYWKTAFGYESIRGISMYIASPMFLTVGWIWLYYAYRKLLHLESFRDEEQYNSFDNIISALTTGGMPFPMVTFSLVLVGLIMVGTVGFKPSADPASRATAAKIDAKMHKSLEMKKGSDMIKEKFDYVIEGVRNTAEVLKLAVAFALEAAAFLPLVAFVLFLYALGEFVNHMASEYDLWARYKGRKAMATFSTGDGELKLVNIDLVDKSLEIIGDSFRAQTNIMIEQHSAIKEMSSIMVASGQKYSNVPGPIPQHASSDEIKDLANKTKSDDKKSDA